MRIVTKKILKFPNTGSTHFQFFGSTVKRGFDYLEGVNNKSLSDTDEVVDGVAWTAEGHHFPIRHGVLSILPDTSVDLSAWTAHFEIIKQSCRENLKMAIDANMERLKKIAADSDGE